MPPFATSFSTNPSHVHLLHSYISNRSQDDSQFFSMMVGCATTSVRFDLFVPNHTSDVYLEKVIKYFFTSKDPMLDPLCLPLLNSMKQAKSLRSNESNVHFSFKLNQWRINYSSHSSLLFGSKFLTIEIFC